MKQHLRIFMTLLMLMIFGGASFGQTTEIFEFTSFDTPKNEISFEGTDCTVTLTKGTNNAPAWVNKEARVYAGGSLIITSNQKITKIVYDFVVNKNGTFGSVTPTGYDESTKTWSSEEGSNSITFNIGGTKGNYGFTKLEITYAGSETKTSTKLTFGTDYDGKTITKNVGDIFEAPATLTPAVEGATITYKSSDETVAQVVDGVVEAKKEGTATITASYAGNDTYRASSASYTIKVEKIATTLSFSNASYTFTEGDQDGTAEITDNYAVLSPSEAGTVSYSVTGSGGFVEIDNGYVLVNTNVVGSATVTASFAGNDKYLAAKDATYTITVNKKPGEVEDGVFDASNPEGYGYGKSSGTTAFGKGAGDIEEGKSIIAGNVTLTVTKKGSSNGTRFWDSGEGELRVYKDAEHQISVPNGYVITDVNLSCNDTKNKNFKIEDADNNSNWTGAKNIVTISYSGQTRIQKITVIYTKLASLTTAASGFATYAADYAVNYTEAGLKAYAVKVSEDKTKVAYTECTGVVPAGKAVLVKGTANTSYSLTPATEDADATFDTDLRISDGTKVGDGSTIFAFGTKNNVSGFKIVKSGVTIPAKKGYLVVEANAAGAKDFFAFDDSTNGIDDPTIEIPDDDVPLFNLAGQRVGKDYKGIVVKNGKKYVNK